MEQGKSLFISSCTRRQLARRRPSRSAGRLEVLVAMAVLLAAVVAFVIVHGGL
jgi:hypothetical protein